MATNWYVDPLDGDNGSGDGTSEGTAWQTIQYAIDNVVQGTFLTGEIINVKSSATITLTASLNWAGLTEEANYPVIIRGYDSTIGDGGKTTISGGGSAYNFINYHSYVTIDSFEFTNFTATPLLFYTDCAAINCSFHNLALGGSYSSFAINSLGISSKIINCEFYDIDASAIKGNDNTLVTGCYFENSGSYDMIYCISLEGSFNGGVIDNNIAILSDSTRFLEGTYRQGLQVKHNTVICTDGTGNGIDIRDVRGCFIHDNIVEGFSVGMYLVTQGIDMGIMVFNNYLYDNTTDITGTGNIISIINNYEEASSGILKTGTASYANRSSYFTPTGNALGNSSNGISSIGAVQLTTAPEAEPTPPSLITTNLELCLNAKDISASDDDDITTWSDSSVEGNDATQATPSRRPVYKTNIIGTHPAVRFAGDVTKSLYGSFSTSWTGFGGATVFILASYYENQRIGSAGLFSLHNGASSDHTSVNNIPLYCASITTGSSKFAENSVNIYYNNSYLTGPGFGGTRQGAPTIMGYAVDSSASNLKVISEQGAAAATTSIQYTGTPSEYILCNRFISGVESTSYGYMADIGLVLVYNEFMSDEDIQSTVDWIVSEFDLEVGSGSGSGGLCRHPGMSGGTNG